MRITVTVETQPQSANAGDAIWKALRLEKRRRYLESAIEKAIQTMMGWRGRRVEAWVFAQ